MRSLDANIVTGLIEAMKKANDVNAVTQRLVKAMEMADIEPELIYAFEKTGRLLTDENMKFLSKEEIQEWDDAIAEYRKDWNDAINPAE